jgi:hypothetical protein
MRVLWWIVLAFTGCGSSEPQPFGFRKHVIDPAFRAEGVAIFDVNRDGRLDIVTRELWYAGPSFSEWHELRTPLAWDPLSEYAATFHAMHADVDADGYDDLIVFGFPGTDSQWCRNPRISAAHWDCHTITAINAGESPQRHDVLGGGGPALVTGIGGFGPDRALAIVTPGELGALWTVEPVSLPDFAPASAHGLGVFDINGDGRLDIVTGSGWFEQGVDPVERWRWHATEICPNNCAHILGHDIDGDGRMDLLGTSPHGYGSWWFEQTGPREAPTFVPHLIDDTISQGHAAQLADLDGDGQPELVTGKRWYAHFAGDPGTDDPVVLVMYKFAREADGVTWTRFDIDDDSGVGNEFDVVDVDNDGKLDIVTATRKGVFWFQQR